MGEASEEPAQKRARVQSQALNEAIFSQSSTDAMTQAFQSAEPYTHVVIRDLCDREVLKQAREELISNVEARYKETDLFKVYQTGDLANMDGLQPELAAKLPTLLRIRNALYSQRFRTLVERITGLPAGTLTTKTDCSSNCYAHGGHLLCHDDVISTRRVSYIVYLTDPDEPWEAQDGGALELYPLRDGGTAGEPAVDPTLELLPHFNSMALFTVQPGRSFHAVQEVYTDAKPRLSISGWFHGTSPPPGADGASLSQLKGRSGGSSDVAAVSGAGAANTVAAGLARCPERAAQPEGAERISASAASDLPAGFEKLPFARDATNGAATHGDGDSDDDEADVLTDAERKLLKRWINPAYTGRAAQRRMVAQWEASSCVELRSFLREEVAAPMRAAIQDADKRAGLGNGQVPVRTAGVTDPWTAVGPPHKRRHLHAAPLATAAVAANCDSEAATSAQDPTQGTAALLRRCESELLRSSAFAKWLRQVTDLGVRAIRSELRRFRPGLDYTVATGDPQLQAAGAGQAAPPPRLDATLCFVDDSDETAAAAWASDDVGGFQCYIVADDEADAAAETYKADAEEDTMISSSAAFNTLHLILRDACLLKFVKFVSHDAPGSRFDVSAEYITDLSSEDVAGER